MKEIILELIIIIYIIEFVKYTFWYIEQKENYKKEKNKENDKK